MKILPKLFILTRANIRDLIRLLIEQKGKIILCTGYQIKTDIKCKHLLVQTKARKFSWEGERPSLDSFRNYIGVAERRILPEIPTAFVI